MKGIEAGVAILRILERGGQGDVCTRCVSRSVGRKRIRVSPTKLLASAGAVDHVRPEAVEVRVVEISPPICRVERAEERSAWADELRGEEDVLAVFVAH